MFKKFDPTKDITGQQQLKSSVQVSAHISKKYAIRQNCCCRKAFEPNSSNNIHRLPMLSKLFCRKRSTLKTVKCKDHIELIATEAGEVAFIKHRDLPYIPSLRLLHKYPFILPHQQVSIFTPIGVCTGAVACRLIKAQFGRFLKRLAHHGARLEESGRSTCRGRWKKTRCAPLIC